MSLIKYIFPLLLVALFAGPSFAKELPAFYEGVRPLGMGGAFTAIADDSNAIFYNPAGLNRLETWSFEVPITIESSDSNIDIADEAQDVDFDSTTETVDFIRDHLGETGHVRFALSPNFIKKNFGFALLGQGQATFRFDNPAFPEASVYAMGTSSAHLAMGHSFLGDKLSIGGTMKYITATTLDETYTAQQISATNFEDTIEDDQLDGSGFGVDIGVIYSLPFKIDSTVGLSVINLGGVDLGDAGELDQQVNIGAAVNYAFEQTSWLNLVGAFDIVDLFQEAGSDDDIYKRLRIGLEAQMPVVTLRTGIYQGYGTFGVSLNLKFAKLEYANYAEEVGAFAGDSVDRRHVLQLAFGAW
jgi:hypothetical protein